MSSPVLRLDPALPLVWRTPDTLQVGIDPVVAVIPQVADAALPLVEGLRAGVTPSGAAMLAAHGGLEDSERESLLTRLRPALRPSVQLTPLALSLRGQSSHRTLIAQHLTLLGHDVSETASSRERIIVANYVLNPAEYREGMSHDIPHTPVIFMDQAVRVGPRVTPGVGPCLQCLWQHEVARNPHHQAVMSQLWNSQAPTDTPAMTLHAVWAALTLINRQKPGEIIRIDAHSGQWRTFTTAASPECLCGSVAVATDP